MTRMNKNRRKLVAGRPNPMALEARIMFDAAAVDTAVAAKAAADAAARESSEAASGAPTADAGASSPATGAPKDMLALDPADAALRPAA